MPLCPLCATDFPALPVDSACKRCTALQALGVDPEHPNYIQTQASGLRFLLYVHSYYTHSELETVYALRHLCSPPWHLTKHVQDHLSEPSLRSMGNFLY